MFVFFFLLKALSMILLQSSKQSPQWCFLLNTALDVSMRFVWVTDLEQSESDTWAENVMLSNISPPCISLPWSWKMWLPQAATSESSLLPLLTSLSAWVSPFQAWLVPHTANVEINPNRFSYSWQTSSEKSLVCGSYLFASHLAIATCLWVTLALYSQNNYQLIVSIKYSKETVIYVKSLPVCREIPQWWGYHCPRVEL